jgi:hypothetical protein
MPALRAEIIAAQKDDEGMGHIKRRMREGDPKSLVSMRMRKERYGSRRGW